MQNFRQPYLPLIIFSLFFLLNTNVYSQMSIADSCRELVYHSDLEQAGFQSLSSGKQADYLSMSVAVNPAAGAKELQAIKETVKNEANLLKTDIAGIKKPAKKLKYVFDHVQSTFLKQYDLEAGFSEMFSTGKFNCLTATILYTLLLDELSVKHTIKFMPGHVYLIAYGDEVPYIFETTDPDGGFIELSKAVQDKALQGLRVAQYMLSNNKPNEKSSNLLDNYFVKLNNLEMKGLIGYQYVNMAVSKLTKEEYLAAYNYIEKAKIFTPLDELNVFSTELLGHSIDQADRSSTLRARLLVKFYATIKNPNKKNFIAEDYKSITYECLAGSFPAPDSIQLIHKIMMDGIKDEDVKAVFEEVYTTNYLYYLQTKASPEKRFAYVYKLYSEGNENQNIINILSETLNNMTNEYTLTLKGMRAYDSLAEIYPKLMQVNIFRYNRCRLLVNLAENAFKQKDATLGEELLEKYDLIDFKANGPENYCTPAYACSLAGSYYFKKGNTAKAKAALNKGLAYEPDNWELKKKISELK